jgi:hypothetical protein
VSVHPAPEWSQTRYLIKARRDGAKVCGDLSSGGPDMTPTVLPRRDNITALSAVESDVLYEVVNGHIVEKAPRGVYEILVGSFLSA